MKNQKGFTLIELLVVIAIIGILSSVVLASLNTARDKGADAAVVANINGVRAQAELEYDDEKDYDDVCEHPNVIAAIAAADDANGGTGSVTCIDSSGPGTVTVDSWALGGQRKSDTNWYCVDYLGTATTTGSAPSITAGAATCL